MKRGRPVYCRDPADWDRIRTRAESVGKSVSDFVMTCALHDGTPTPTSPLVLTPEEQRDLFRNFQKLDQRLVGMFFSRGGWWASTGRGGPTSLSASQRRAFFRHEGPQMTRAEKRTFYISCTDGEWAEAKRRGRCRRDENLALPCGAGAECGPVDLRRPPAAAGAEC